VAQLIRLLPLGVQHCTFPRENEACSAKKEKARKKKKEATNGHRRRNWPHEGLENGTGFQRTPRAVPRRKKGKGEEKNGAWRGRRMETKGEVFESPRRTPSSVKSLSKGQNKRSGIPTGKKRKEEVGKGKSSISPST